MRWTKTAATDPEHHEATIQAKRSLPWRASTGSSGSVSRRYALAALVCLSWGGLALAATETETDPVPQGWQDAGGPIACVSAVFSSVADAAACLSTGDTFCIQYDGVLDYVTPDIRFQHATVWNSCNPPLNYRSDPTTNGGIDISFVPQCPDGYTFHLKPGDPNSADGNCQIAVVRNEHGRKNGCCDFNGNPIYPGTGNKREDEIDYVGAGAFPLQLKLTYNSAVAFGNNWLDNWEGPHAVYSHPYTSFPETATFYREDGSAFTFTRTGNGPWVSDSDVNYSLTGGDQNYTLSMPTGADVEYYGTGNVLTQIRTASGTVKYQLDWDLSGTPFKLLDVKDAFGHQISYSYLASGAVDKLTDPAGGVVQFAYGSNGTISSVTFPDMTVRTYVYNESSLTSGANLPLNLTGIVDESVVRYASYGYSAAGTALSSQHAGGAGLVTASFATEPALHIDASIDVPNRIKYITTTNVVPTGVSVTDTLGQVRHYTYASLNGGVAVTGADGPCFANCAQIPNSQTLDANGNVVSKTDFNGVITTYAYDTTRNLETSRTEASGTPRARTITTTWSPSFRLPLTITEPNRITSYTYDANGNALTRTVTDAATSTSRTWTYTYNSYGQVLTADGPRTDVLDKTTYTYYACTSGYQCGQLNTVTDAAGNVTTYNTYNAHGQRLTITDPNGVVTTLTYDLRLRLASRQVGTELTSFAYYPAGLLQKVTMPDLSYVQYTYDAAHRLTGIADGLGNHITYTLDAMGNRTAEGAYDPSSVLSRAMSRVYSSLNLLSQQIGSAGTAAVTTTLGYDSNGNQTAINAPLSRNTVNTYDELNRLSQITDPASGVTHFGYDANDNLTSVQDPTTLSTSYTYTGFGDLLTQVSPQTGTTNNTYDSGGNLATSLDARNKTATYSYDVLNRVAQIAYGDQTIGYTYDTGANGKGRLTGASDANHSMSWSYDGLGRLTGKTQTVGGVPLSVSYGYTNGDLATLTTPSGQSVTYSYTNHLVTSVAVNGASVLASAVYEPFGPTRGWTWGNGASESRLQDTDGNPSQISGPDFTSYALDSAFRITGISNSSNSSLSWTYGYDTLDRLTSGTATNATPAWTYDADGNRQGQIGGTLPTYGASNIALSYNNRNRLVSYAGATATTFAYNALGQRVQKSANGGTTVFMYDEAGHLLGEYSGSGALIQETVWLGALPFATIRPHAGGGIDVYYVHADHLGAPRTVTRSSDNAIVWRWDSDPFGTAPANSNPGSLGTFVYNLRYPGQYYDSETGLNYNYFRDYDPQMGRYVESDPIGQNGGVNTYAYVSANPLNGIDPRGLETTVACRDVNDPRARIFGAKHCFIVVWHRDRCNGKKVLDSQFSLAGQPMTYPQNSSAPTFMSDRSEWLWGSGPRYDVAPPAGESIAQFDAAVTAAGTAYDSGSGYNANGITGPNSNTATETIIRNAGGTLPVIPGAFGQFYNGLPPLPPGMTWGK